MNNEIYLELHVDESEHVSTVPEDVDKEIDLASGAALLVLRCLTTVLDDSPDIEESKKVIALLAAKAAQNIRFACTGLTLGYYSGTYAVLRSAFESLTYVALFTSEPERVPEWLKSELLQEKSMNGNVPPWSDEARRAKRTLFASEKARKIISDEVHRLIRDANRRIHTSVQGLVQEFGIEIQAERTVRKGDERQVESEEDSPLYLYCRYENETITDLSMFAFYVGHRLLDIVEDYFEIQAPELKEGIDDWHAEIRSDH